MSLKKNIIANYLGQGWTALMGLAFVPVYIDYLGVEAWGLVGFMTMLQAWLTLLDMGLTPTLSREMARFQAGAHSAQTIRDLLRSLEVIYGCVAVAVVGIVWFIAPWVATHWLNVVNLSAATVAQAIGMIGLVLAARMAEQVYRGAIQGLQHQVWLNGAQGVLATLRWGGVVGVLAWVDTSIEAFFLWQGLVSLLTVIILSRKTYHLLPPGERPARFELAAIVRIRRFAGGMAATTLLALLLTQVDKLLLSKLVSLEEFGYYILAASVAGALAFLVAPIATAVSPRLTELVAKSEQQVLIDTYHRATQWLAAVLIPAALVIAAFAEPLLYAWTGNVSLAQQAGPLLILLALGTLCNGFMHVPYMMQLAHGWTGFAVRVNIVAVCFIVPAILWAVPRFGAIGAAWAWFALNAGYVFIGVHFMHRRLLPDEKWRWYWGAVIKPLSIGTITVLALRYWIVLPSGRVPMVATMTGIGILVMGVVLWTVPASREFLRRQFKTLRGHVLNG
ncbi:oligosaccharide flippase family protein [Sulfuriflexus mobilis]|uniref:oligosaccharide flippase family protein n=1 Tax=Sulfuriflexus mobilis TaxID=1811807 RepID=UPI000F83589C|nr:oligosaccharide flippase family protein [Sulfuriflexus mobilis]